MNFCLEVKHDHDRMPFTMVVWYIYVSLPLTQSNKYNKVSWHLSLMTFAIWRIEVPLFWKQVEGGNVWNNYVFDLHLSIFTRIEENNTNLANY